MPNELPLTKLVSNPSTILAAPSASREIGTGKTLWKDISSRPVDAPPLAVSLRRSVGSLQQESGRSRGLMAVGNPPSTFSWPNSLPAMTVLLSRRGTCLKTQDAGLWRSLFGSKSTLDQGARFWPVLINGCREPLETALLRGLAETVERFGCGRQISRLKGRLSKLATRRKASGRTAEVVALFESTLQAAVKSGARGLLLIIDELGKLLEYAANHSEDGECVHLAGIG